MPASERTKEDASISPVEYKRIGIAIVLVKKTDDQNSAPDVTARQRKRREIKSQWQVEQEQETGGEKNG